VKEYSFCKIILYGIKMVVIEESIKEIKIMSKDIADLC